MYNNINSNNFLFYMILIFSSFISISSNSWLGCWVGLEINLLSFIPLISKANNLLSSEAALKYFLIQSLASANLIFIVLLMFLMNKNFIQLNNIFTILMNSTLMMKMGMVPFHFWFPQVMEGLSWMNSFILMTWQKITPMILLSYYYNYNFMIIIIMLTALVSAISGLNQSSLRKLMSFSSINHLSWMISAILISENLWMFYFMIYSIINLTLCMMFYMMNTYYFNQFFFMKMNFMIKFMLFLNLLSLGGLPPFLGFINKWVVINYLIQNNLYFMTFMLIMSALITLYFYIRLTYSAFLINYSKFKFMKFYINNNMILCMMIMSFFSLNTLIFSTMLTYLY